MKNADRLESLLQAILLHLMKDVNQQEKIKELNLAGFSNLEIADMLDTTPGVVAQTLYESRKKPKKKTRRRALTVRKR